MEVKSKLKGYISVNKDYPVKQFQGEVDDKQIRFPKELGAEHPFNFVDTENVYKTFGLLNGAINKITDNIVGEFIVNAKNPNVLKLVNDFIKDNNFSVVLREWIREGLVKGNGFIEIDSKEGKIRVLNANNIYVKRDKKGNVLEYTQYAGDKNKLNTKKIITFTPDQIAHLKINCISDEPYGMGLIMPNERVIQNIILNEQDIHKLQSRKAGAPIHVQVGIAGEVADTAAINAFANSMQYMNNKTEWVTDANVKMDVLNFGEIGKNLNDMLMYDFRELIAGIDIPEVLMNSGQLNEGIARVQLESWQRRIMSYQDMIEPIIIEKIINPYLIGQGLSGEVDFVWNLPGEAEVNARLQQIQMILSGFTISENLKRMLELEVARLLNIQDAEKFLLKPGVGDDMMKKAEGEMPQPEVPGAKPNATAMLKENADLGKMTIREFINLKEIPGFNYSDYLLAILRRVKIDKFEQLTAITEKDFADGLLNDSEINKLRTILKEGFRRNQSMNNIEANLRESVKLKDRITENGSKIPADNRYEMITRTETIRLSNEGLMDLWKVNDIEKYKFVAAWQPGRTCLRCMELDGRIFKVSEAVRGVNQPDIHIDCRCSTIGVIE